MRTEWNGYVDYYICFVAYEFFILQPYYICGLVRGSASKGTGVATY